MSDEQERISARLRAVEQVQASQDVRIAANERAINEVRREVIGMRQERREDAQRLHDDMGTLHAKLNDMHADVSLSKGVRRALMWVFGISATIAAAAIGAWATLWGGNR